MRHIQILGPGCSRCEGLKMQAKKAVAESGVEAVVEKIEDINVIAGFGVTITPALAIDGQVKSVGRIPSVGEIKKLLGGVLASFIIWEM